MKRLLVRALLGLVLVLAVGVAWLFLRPLPPVTVTVVNASPKPIAWVKLKHEKGFAMASHIPAGHRSQITFPTRGETSYTLRVRFADGTEVDGLGNYAEPGYRFTDTVTEKTVTNELEYLPY